MLLGIHHIAVICHDYQRSKHFYCEILGLDVIAEHYRQARNSWKLDLQLPDGSQLELFSFPDAPTRPSFPEAQGLRHLAFRVVSVSDAVTWLTSHGINCEPIRIDAYTGKQFTFFNDPDNLPLELYEI
ncbi:VOC family protein [Shewanella yunxiaonensis]|uniref:VOC family protein n=1 Tax=Shewanella yunxiaonensis TaxID=2829809 RepID=A0ABX7YUM1_9GAMM|nr:VOC family protein [Shewanella yunxiaonensis]QUN06031.1 VOC family protein [Shewanella yunxiaonensis]